MSYKDKLNPQQKKAVCYGEGPLLIVAGAGTGKTTVITERINYLITEKKLQPNEVLALTFTEKAAAEMEERVDKALPYGYVDLWVYTFHAFAERLLKEHGLEIGLTTDFKLLDETAAWLLVRNNLDKFDLDYYRPLGNPNKFIHALLKHFSKAKDEMVKPDDYLNHAEKFRLDNDLRKDETAAQEVRRLEEVAGAYHVYQQLLLDNDYLDFGDLINYAYELLTRRPAILKKYQEQFKYILVDEFQDTNYAQYQLIKLLAGEINNVTVVGDDDQCLPPQSKVLTPEGEKLIKDIKKQDEVLTAVGKGHIGISKVSRVFKNKKKVKLLKIKTKKGFELTVTDNHKMFCHVPSANHRGKYFYVYLMWRSDVGWRIGTTKNLTWRLSLERSADKIIGVKACNSEAEARFYEHLYSLRYSIPTYCFQKREDLILDFNKLKLLYQELDVESGVKRLAKDLNIDLSSSHVNLGAVIRGNKKRIKINLNICYRNYRSKHHVIDQKEIMRNSLVQHELSLETSDEDIIKSLKENGYVLHIAKKGKRLRIINQDLKALENDLLKIESITGGLTEARSKIGKLNYQTLKALVMPSKNLLVGHFLPVKIKNEIIYDEIISIDSKEKIETVYDLEIDRTHNFIAQGVVVHNSIYKFRGASISNILEFKKDHPKAQEVYLNTNYRTKQNILDAAYKFIQLNNPNRLEVQLKADNKKLSKKLKSALEGQGVIEHLHEATLAEEVASLVNKIKALGEKTGEWSQFAILVRANSQAQPFIEGLERAGIPYQFVASKGLYAKEIILNLTAFLRLLDDYHESDAMYRYLTLPIFNLDQSEIIKITHQAYKKRWTLYEVARQARALLRLSDQNQRELDKAVNLLEKYISQAKNQKCSRIVFDWLNDSGYLKYVDSLEELKKRQEFSYLSQFYQRIKAFEEINDDKSVKNFLQQLGLEIESGEQGSLQPLGEDEGPQMVKVMTVHSAKGLEFKNVFIVNLVDQRFPTRERKESIELPDELIKEIVPEGDIHLQEERRLFYVGLTRAKESLYLTSASNYGGVRKKKLSVFLTDLGFEQTEAKEKKGVKLEKISQIKSQPPASIKEFLPSKFSFTQIKDFQSCPRLYYYKYIVKLPAKGSHYFSFGTTMHSTLQKFYEEFKKKQGTSQGDLFGQKKDNRKKSIRELVSLAELNRFYEAAWIEDWYESKKQKDEYYKKGQEILKQFYESEKLLESYPSFLEKGFNLKLGEYTLTGKIDRIDEVGQSLRILDYKTGQPKDKLTSEDKAQLLIYQMAARALFNQEVKDLVYYYLEDDSQLSFLGDDKEIKELQVKVIDTIDQIKNFDFQEFLKGHGKCDKCEGII